MGFDNSLRRHSSCPLVDIRNDRSLLGAGTEMGHIREQRLGESSAKEISADCLTRRPGDVGSKRAGQHASQRTSLGCAQASFALSLAEKRRIRT
jgi:hypothetical protein